MCVLDERADLVLWRAGAPGLIAPPPRAYDELLHDPDGGDEALQVYVAITWYEHAPTCWPIEGRATFLETLHGPLTSRTDVQSFWWGRGTPALQPSRLIVVAAGEATLAYFDPWEQIVAGQRLQMSRERWERFDATVWPARVRADRAAAVTESRWIEAEDLETLPPMDSGALWAAGFRGEFCAMRRRLLVGAATAMVLS